MTVAIGLESQALLAELHAILLALDPARWRDEKAREVRDRLVRLAGRAREILDSWASPFTDPRLERMVLRLRALAAELEDAAHRLSTTAERLREELREVRVRLVNAYEEAAASLKALEVRVPGLRPTNLHRSFLHMGSGLFALAMIEHVLDRRGLILVPLAWAAWAWSMELLRTRNERLNRLLIRVFRTWAHPAEYHRVNSATWYGTALVVLALTMPLFACSVAVIVLGIADPVAAMVGRRWGRTRIRANRSLEGSLAFAASGTLAAFGVMAAYYGGNGVPANLLIAAAAALPAAVAEACSTRLDDNLTVPVTAAVGAAAAAAMLGV